MATFEGRTKRINDLDALVSNSGGQPLNGPSNYSATQQFARVWGSDDSLGVKLTQTWDWLNYTTPDAEQRLKAYTAQARAEAEPWARIDALRGSGVAGVVVAAGHLFGAGESTLDALAQGAAGLEGALGGLGGYRTLTLAPPMPNAMASQPRGPVGPADVQARDALRAYLDQKFGRTGDLNRDINARGVTDIQHGIDRLAREGHAPGRHGPRVTEAALDNRALFKFDPITGTATDYYTRGPHNVGRNATQLLSNTGLLRAEAHVRGTPEFSAARIDAELLGRDFFPVKGVPLENALGPRYLNDVFGKARVGSINNPTGTVQIDFTDGTLTSVFTRGLNGYWNLHTMYPEPKP